jgi:hypothetical protein
MLRGNKYTTPTTPAQAAKALRLLHAFPVQAAPQFRLSALIRPVPQWTGVKMRVFSSSRLLSMREFFPEPDSPSIKTTEAAWPHPMYESSQIKILIALELMLTDTLRHR